MAVKPKLDVATTIAAITDADVNIKAWRAFSGNNAAKSPPIGEFQNQIQSLNNFTVGVKDIIDVAGVPTRMGSAIFKHAPPAAKDARCVALMREAGAVIVGKTVTTEFASFVPSETRNPLNLNHTPGGSSAGSAAAVAAKHVDIAIGTQTAGSILRPAAYCGVIGFKPSIHLVPTDGVWVQSPTLDSIGVFARTIEDCAAWLHAMPGNAINATSPSQLRISFINNWLNHASVEMRSALIDLQETLTQQGHHTQAITLPPPFAELDVSQKIIQDVESARALASYVDAGLSPALQQAVKAGMAISEQAYQDALKYRAEAIFEASQLFTVTDIWIMPAATGSAPLGLGSTGDAIFNRLASALGAPALSLPFFHAQSPMPLGIQLIGAAGGDAALLEQAREINRALPHQHQPHHYIVNEEKRHEYMVRSTRHRPRPTITTGWQIR